MSEFNALPTHLAFVMRRLQVAGEEDSADTFLVTTYITEALVKTIATALLAGVRKSSPRVADKFDFELVHADGLGTWEKVIGDLTGQSIAGYVDSDLQQLIAWLTQRRTRPEDEWAKKIARETSSIIELLGLPDAEFPSRFNLRFVLGQLVRIRNKTKAHGAVGRDFFERANPLYISATKSLLEGCPLTSWNWYHCSTREKDGSVRAILLKGPTPTHVKQADAEKLRPSNRGLHFRTHEKSHLFHCGPLMSCNSECNSFSVSNGGYTSTGSAEFIDYGTGKLSSVPLPQFLKTPAPLPASETEGSSDIDIYSNVFGNLPARPTRYVARPKLEKELLRLLRDKNHPIVTLHGRGGIGKTSLALHICHLMAEEPSPQYEYVVWLSARDLELKPSGASDVRRAIANLESVAKALGRLFDRPVDIDLMAQILQDPKTIDIQGILFVFDNFETLDDPKECHRFLDTHTHIPNKVLITSRERSFKGDFPIEVGGMERDEADILLRQEAAILMIDSAVIMRSFDDIYDFTDGHPYVMRVLLGEIAKEGKWVPLKSLAPRRGDVLDAVFERSFNKMSTAGRRVFLTVAKWRSVVSELSLFVVLGLHDLDIEEGIEECVRLSLLSRSEMADGSFCYSTPELARVFAKKKLDGDPDRLLVLEDVETIRSFGPLKLQQAKDGSTESVVQRFIDGCFSKLGEADEVKRKHMSILLTRIAEEWPAAWVSVGRFREAISEPVTEVDYAFRRAVEERPFDKAAWLARAEFAKNRGDDITAIAALMSAVDAGPSDIPLLREAANELCKYLDAHKQKIPQIRRGVYLASVRSHMSKVSNELDATGLSRLAWLFLMEGDQQGAWKYAEQGLYLDSNNLHCQRIVESLQSQGFVPSSTSG